MTEFVKLHAATNNSIGAAAEMLVCADMLARGFVGGKVTFTRKAPELEGGYDLLAIALPGGEIAYLPDEEPLLALAADHGPVRNAKHALAHGIPPMGQ